MKRRIAVVLGMAVIAMTSPAVAMADTGSASTGSSSTGSSQTAAALIEALPAIWQECGLRMFAGCGGVVTQIPGEFGGGL